MAGFSFILTFFSLLFFTASNARFSPAEKVAVGVDSRSMILLPSDKSSEPESSEFRPASIWHPIKRRFDWTRVVRRSFAVHNRHRERQFEVEAQIRPINELERYIVKGERRHRQSGGGRAAIGRLRHRRSFLNRHRHRRSRWHRKEEEMEARGERRKIQKLLAGL